jgi:trehalose 6-phosphate synthase
MIASLEPQSRLLTVSNRGPMEFHRDEDGNVVAVPGQGGLATALTVAAQLYPTTWLSSPMSELDRQIALGEERPAGMEVSSHFVATDPHAYSLFYGRFSNEVLWLLQHSLPFPEELTEAEREEGWQAGYKPLNEAFADKVVEELDSGEIRAVMFHDYHFYLAPGLVRQKRPDAYLQHFLHIPWPEPQVWRRLPIEMLRAICEGMLANDSIVFQTHESAQNFMLTCQSVLPALDVDLEDGIVVVGDRTSRVWANGISVDPDELVEAAATPEFSRYRYLLRADPGQKTIMRVDRLDLTKNVVRGFQAYELLLEQHPELREKVCFLALLVPSKSDIDSYRRYQEQTLALAASINKRFGNLHWKPVRLIFEHNRMQALAAMSLYDVMLINPVADGMNLVAKEGPMLNRHDGVLVLSKKAGAYEELSCGALGIDPYDVEATAAALYHALTMSVIERRERATLLRQAVKARDLRHWFRLLLADIEAHTRQKTTAA